MAYVPFATPSTMILRGSSASSSNGIGSILGIFTHSQLANALYLASYVGFLGTSYVVWEFGILTRRRAP